MKILKIALSALALTLAPFAFAAPAAKVVAKTSTTMVKPAKMAVKHKRIVAKRTHKIVAKRTHKIVAKRTSKRIVAKRATKTTMMKAAKK
jgi:hypothetical protein